MACERLFFSLQPLPGGRVLAIGGDPEGTSEAYDPGSGSWGSLADMTAVRYNAASVALEDGRVLSAGGVSDDSVLSSAEVYSPEDDTWAAVEGMSTPRASFGLASVPGGRVVATGSWSTLGASNTTECLCDSSWRAGDQMARARGMHGTAMTENGTVLAIGGWDGSKALSSVEMFVEVQTEEPDPGLCEPMDLLPLVRAVADELRGYSENGLVAKLFVAQAAYDCGSTDLCLRVLDAFYDQVCAFYTSGHLGDAGAAMLYDGYVDVVDCLGGEPLPPIT
jgi:hypothetical protein